MSKHMRCMLLHCLRQTVNIAIALALVFALLEYNMLFVDAVSSSSSSNSSGSSNNNGGGANKASDVHSLAGWVEIDNLVAPYVVVRVVEGSSKTVIRTSLLDATHTFSFIGLPITVNEVQVMVQLPWRDREIDFDHSILSVPIELLGGNNVRLKVSIRPITSDTYITADREGSNLNQLWQTPANNDIQHTNESGFVASFVTLFLLVAAWTARQRLVSLFEMSGFKPPKPKRVMIQR